MADKSRIELQEDISALLNWHSAENPSNTPDFILAQYLLGCLEAYNTAVQQRETWYGRDPLPASPEVQEALGKPA
jgi:hypothetical protein